MNRKELPSRIARKVVPERKTGPASFESEQIRRQGRRGRMLATVGLAEIFSGVGVAAVIELSPLTAIPTAVAMHGVINLYDGLRMMPQQDHPRVRQHR